MWNLNTTQMNVSMKQKQTHRHREQTCGSQGSGVGWVGGGKDWEFEISRCKIEYIRRISKKVLLYSTGKYIQSPGMNHNGKEY